jgi:hypothetical protein
MPQWDIVPSALLEAWKQVARHLTEPCAKQGGVRRTGRFQVRQLPLFVPGDWAGCYPYARSMPAASSADEAVVPDSRSLCRDGIDPAEHEYGAASVVGSWRRGLCACGRRACPPSRALGALFSCGPRGDKLAWHAPRVTDLRWEGGIRMLAAVPSVSPHDLPVLRGRGTPYR